METVIHSLESLFDQLGLDSSTQSIAQFASTHRLMPGVGEFYNAAFWSPSQAAFLKQSKEEDADWAVVVDQLNVMLHE
jgi:hypothetical protein